MAIKEVVWDANGGNPVELDIEVVQELVDYDLATRNGGGQAQFIDFVYADNALECLHFHKTGERMY